MQRCDNEAFKEIAENYDMITYRTLENLNFPFLLKNIKDAQDKNFSFKKGVAVKVDEEHYKIMFGEKFNGFLYRGENNAAYELCSSLQRVDGIDRCIEWCKADQFKTYIKNTPYYTDFPKMVKIDGYKLKIDLTALAQHYGFRTNHIDFTQNREVAEFFAYTTCENGIYKPITDFTKPVKIYQVKLADLIKHNRNYYQIVGFQIAKRALAQEAHGLDVSDMDKLDLSIINQTVFLPDKKRVQEIYEKFDGGEKLFPVDLMGDIANKMNNDKLGKKHFAITSSSLIKYAKENKLDYNKLRCAVSKKGYIIAPGEFYPSENYIQIIQNELLQLKHWINKMLIY